MGQGGFEELQAWQRSKDLAVGIYRFTEEGAISKAFGLREQLRRSAVSVPSNLAEGDDRGTDKEAVRFFYIAKGSLAELRTQLRIAFEVGYLRKEDFTAMDDECNRIGRMIGALIRARRMG